MLFIDIQSFNRVDEHVGWPHGDTININHLKVGDRVANGSFAVVADELVLAEQNIAIGPLGQVDTPKFKLARRLKFESMFGSHHGYLFPETGMSYNLYSYSNPAIVNAVRLPKMVTLFKEYQHVASVE
jgi:hypothetical protein